MNLKEVSFWYHDPSLKFPSEVSGLMNINLPPGGVDIDVDFGLLPTLSGKQRREKKQSFHYISEVRVTLSRDTAIALKKTNHPILISTFKRTVKKKLIHRIETVLSQQIKVVLEMVDNIAWDLHQRAKAFDDTELTDTGPKYVAATFSEWRRLRKQPGLLSGWIVTTLGVIKEDPGLDITLAFGAGPQIISGDKHGPRPPAPSPDEAKQDIEPATHDTKKASKHKKKTDGARIKSFKQTIDAKVEEERKSGGWKSAAFDITSE